MNNLIGKWACDFKKLYSKSVLVFQLAGWCPVLSIRAQSDFPAGRLRFGTCFWSRAGFPAGWLVILYPASGLSSAFRLASPLFGTWLSVPVRFSGCLPGNRCPASRPSPVFRCLASDQYPASASSPGPCPASGFPVASPRCIRQKTTLTLRNRNIRRFQIGISGAERGVFQTEPETTNPQAVAQTQCASREPAIHSGRSRFS